LLFPALLVLAACSDHPLAGSWNQHTGADAEGMSLEFQTDGDEIMVHTAPDASGHHEHVHGTYTFDAASGALTVNAALIGDDKAKSWTGKLNGDKLELGAADTKLTFEKGSAAHGH
jgi:hypothetical protein